jgi:glutathione-regulated potassium-efflux system ancillary protein KefG
MNKILVILAHPALHKSKIHRELSEAAKSVQGVTFNDLYDNYPDFYINIKYEQKLLLEHDIVVWQHPLYWYSCPSLMKEWIDTVLEHNFAYGKSGTSLKGKMLMSAISTGGSSTAYSTAGSSPYTLRQYLAPFHQTARLCRMEYLPPFVVHGSHQLKTNDIAKYSGQYREVLEKLRDNGLTPEERNFATYMNDIL